MYQDLSEILLNPHEDVFLAEISGETDHNLLDLSKTLTDLNVPKCSRSELIVYENEWEWSPDRFPLFEEENKYDIGMEWNLPGYKEDDNVGYLGEMIDMRFEDVWNPTSQTLYDYDPKSLFEGVNDGHGEIENAEEVLERHSLTPSSSIMDHSNPIQYTLPPPTLYDQFPIAIPHQTSYSTNPFGIPSFSPTPYFLQSPSLPSSSRISLSPLSSPILSPSHLSSPISTSTPTSTYPTTTGSPVPISYYEEVVEWTPQVVDKCTMERRRNVVSAISSLMDNPKRKRKWKTRSFTDNKTLMMSRLSELYDLGMELSDCKNKRERLIYCALNINAQGVSTKNISTRLALKNVIREELTASEAASRYRIKRKSLLVQYHDLMNRAEMEREAMDMDAIEMSEPEQRLNRLEAIRRAEEEKQKQMEKERMKKKEIMEQSQVYSVEEEVIQSIRNLWMINDVFSRVFKELFSGWSERRGIRETIITLENAIVEGVRPSLKHTPSGDLKLEIETDVIPYYRLIVEEFKKNAQLSRLVKKKRVMVRRPPSE